MGRRRCRSTEPALCSCPPSPELGSDHARTQLHARPGGPRSEAHFGSGPGAWGQRGGSVSWVSEVLRGHSPRTGQRPPLGEGRPGARALSSALCSDRNLRNSPSKPGPEQLSRALMAAAWRSALAPPGATSQNAAGPSRNPSLLTRAICPQRAGALCLLFSCLPPLLPAAQVIPLTPHQVATGPGAFGGV